MTHIKRIRWLLIMAAAVLGLPMLAATPAHAEPPANDSIRGAVPIELDSTTTFDSTEATADARSRWCVGDHSVWFRFTAPTTQQLRMTTAGSSFDTRLAIFSGPRTKLRLVDCDSNGGPGKTAADWFRIRAGERYWVAVSTARGKPGGPGVVTIGTEPATADPVVTGARSGGVSGRLIVSGTTTCTSDAEVWFQATVSQRAGDNVARGRAWTRGRLCGTEPTQWNLTVDSETGWAFQPGPALLRLRHSVWNGLAESEDVLRQTITAVDDPDARPAH